MENLTPRKVKEIVDGINSGHISVEALKDAESLHQNKDIFYALVRKVPNLYKKVPTSLKDDIEIASWVVKTNGDLLVYASNQLKNDLTIAGYAVKSRPASFRHCGKTVRNNKVFVEDLMIKSGYGVGVFEFVGKELKADKDFVEKALSKNPSCWPYIDKNFKNTISMAKIALKGKQRSDKYSVIGAIGQNDEVKAYAIHENPVHRYNDCLLNMTNGFSSYMKSQSPKFLEECIENCHYEEARKISADQPVSLLLNTVSVLLDFMKTEDIKVFEKDNLIQDEAILRLIHGTIEKRRIEEMEQKNVAKKKIKRSII